MSIKAVLKSLQALTDIHEQLLKVSMRKTDIIKEGSVEKLQAILNEERQFIQTLEQTEKDRQQEVEKWYINRNLINSGMTITQMLEILTDQQEQQELEQLTIELTQIITKLKQQEQLNKALIQQSMQFVQLSLDMLQPTIHNINYGKQQITTTSKRSVFDSKA